MTAMLLLSAIVVPLSLAAFAMGRHGPWLVILSPLPAFALASVASAPQSVTLEWLLLGIQIGLDDTGRVFLMASSLVWLVAAVYAAGSLRRSLATPRFRIFFQLAMAGNFALILAQDMVTFFLGFAVMGLSAYGLVAHQRSLSTRRAARLYLAWTILGEVILFCALVLIAAQSGGLDFDGLRTTTPSHFAVALIVIGFGIKLALPGLHVWLPLTYAAAPAPGVAVLSGPMISAGLLGWIRFLPPGNETLVPWGEFLIVTGVVGAAYGVTAGLFQRNSKVILGYSSISKMGVLTSGFGVALAHPNTAPMVLYALTLYAVHHLIVKSALFIGIDLFERGKARAWVVSGLIVLGLALAGAPLTSGALAKGTLVNGLPASASWFGSWLTVTALGSTLLLGRLLHLLLNTRITLSMTHNFELTSWWALIVIVITTPLFLGTQQELVSSGLPIALGAAVILFVWHYRPAKLAAMLGRIPPGDILYLMRSGVRRVRNDVIRNTSIRSKLRKPRVAIRTRQDKLWQSTLSVISRSLQPRVSSPKWVWVGTVWLALGGLAILTITTG